MKKFRKVLGLLLASAMMVGMLSACGGSGNTTTNPTGGDTTASAGAETASRVKETDVSKMPVVKVHIPTGANTDNNEKVVAAINEILAKEIGVQIELTWHGFGSYSQELNMMMTGSGEADVVYVGNISTYYNNGQLLDMTPYYSKYEQDFLNIFKPQYLEVNKRDGKIYAITVNNYFSSATIVHANKKMMDDLGVDPRDGEIWTLEELHDLVKLAVEKNPGVMGVVPQSGSILLMGMNWDNLGDNYQVGVVEDNGNSGKVISITDCAEYVDFAKAMRTWYQEGLIMQDVLSNTETWTPLIQQGRGFCVIDRGTYPPGITTDDSYWYNLAMNKNWSSSSAGSGLTYGICANTKYPEESFEVLRQLYINEDIANLLKWGIEGENYVVNDAGKAAFPEGQDLSNDTWTCGHVNGWILPNNRNGLLAYNTVDGYREIYAKYDADAIVGATVGCVFDSSPVSDQYTSCINTYNKYYAAVMSGAVDTDETLEQYKAELKAAGEDDVIAEKQKQLDAHLAK